MSSIDVVSHDFAEFLTDLGHGQVNQRLGQKWADVVAAVREHGGTGELTVKIQIQGKGDKAIVHVADIKTKKPDAPLEAEFFFFDGEAGLAKDNPRQTKMAVVYRPPMRGEKDHD